MPIEQLPFGSAVWIAGAVLAPVFSAGAAWMGVKAALNGMRSSVTRIEANVDRLVKNDSAQDSRLSHLEATQDGHAGWIARVERATERRTERRD